MKQIEKIFVFWNAIIQEKHLIGKEKYAIIIENHEVERKDDFPKKEGYVNRTCGISASVELPQHKKLDPNDYDTERNYRDLNQYQDDVYFQPVVFNLDKNWMILRSEDQINESQHKKFLRVPDGTVQQNVKKNSTSPKMLLDEIFLVTMVTSKISTVCKSNMFEIKVFKSFRNIKIDCQRVSQSKGDGHIDIFGNYNHYLLLIQCKNYTNKIEVDYICAFESVIARFDKDKTIGIYVISVKDGYTKGSIKRANSSECYLLLMNIWDLDQDIPKYLSKISKDNSVEEKLYNIEKRINEIIETFQSQEKLIRKIRNDQIKLENNQIKLEISRIRKEDKQKKISFINSILLFLT
ncbi:6649_t:CDS:2 [Funneliformis geosporum]|nr:6649_t:CDS:2 [Funneliformis geosporum]